VRPASLARSRMNCGSWLSNNRRNSIDFADLGEFLEELAPLVDPAAVISRKVSGTGSSRLGGESLQLVGRRLVNVADHHQAVAGEHWQGAGLIDQLVAFEIATMNHRQIEIAIFRWPPRVPRPRRPAWSTR